MALSQVQHAGNNSNVSGNTVVAAFGSPTGAGNLIIVGFQGNNTPSVSSITDDKGNTYTKIAASAIISAGNREVEVWYCNNATGGVVNVTCTMSATGTVRRTIYMVEVSGQDSTAGPDAVATASDTGGGNPLNGAAITTVAANTYIFTMARTSTAVTAVGNSFVFTDNTSPSGAAASQIVSSASTYTPSWGFGTTPTDDCYVSVSFAQASAAVPGFAPYMRNPGGGFGMGFNSPFGYDRNRKLWLPSA